MLQSASGWGKLSATREKHCTTLHNEYLIARTETLSFVFLAAPFSEQGLHPRAEGCRGRGCGQGGPGGGCGGRGHLLPRVSRPPWTPALSLSLTVSISNIIHCTLCFYLFCVGPDRLDEVDRSGNAEHHLQQQLIRFPTRQFQPNIFFNCILGDLSTTS